MLFDASFEKLYKIICLVLIGQGKNVKWEEINTHDLEKLMNIAIQEDVAQLIYWHFFKHNDPLSKELELIKDKTYYYYLLITAQNVIRYRELERIRIELAKEDIPIVLLKGADLASSLYVDIGLRPFNDIDILIRDRDIGKAVLILQSLDYKIASPDLRPGLRKRINTEFEFFNQTANISVELHWTLIVGLESYFTPDIDWFWRQIEEWRGKTNFLSAISDRNNQSLDNLCALNPTANLLNLTAHLALRHNGRYKLLRWYYDIHLLIQQYNGEIDWGEFYFQASRFNWGDYILTALKETKSLFGTVLPSDWFVALDLQKHQGNHKEIKTVISGSTVNAAIGIMNGLNNNAKLLYILSALFPSHEYMVWRYKPSLTWSWPLFYFRRWWDVLNAGL